jgi:hypothetical protein
MLVDDNIITFIMAHTKKQKKNSSKGPKLSNKPLENDPMKTRRRNKVPKPRPNNKKTKSLELMTPKVY